jgi:hypothetical protein
MGEYLSGFEPDREVQSRMGGPCESQLDQVSGELSPAAQPRSKGEVLIIAYYFPPQNTAGAARPSRFHKYLPEFGYRTQVISAAAPAGDSSWRDVRRTSQAGAFWPVAVGSFAGRVVQHFSRRYSDRLPWTALALSTAKESVAEDVRVVLSTHPPLATHLVGWRIKRRYGAKWVADFRDPVYVPGTKDAHSYAARIEPAIFRNADCIIANTDAAAEMWRSRYPHARQKIHTIWNGYDPQEVLSLPPLPRRGFRCLTHTGDMYGVRQPVVLLRSLTRLFTAGVLDPREIRVRLVGPVQESLAFLDMPEFRRLRETGVLECDGCLVPRSEALRAMGESDYLLLLDLWLFNRNVQVPSKLFDYVRFGRPVLAFTTPDSPAERILRDSQIRYECVFSHDSDGEVDRKIAAFLKEPSSYAAPSPWFGEAFNGRTQAQALSRIIDELIGDELIGDELIGPDNER